MRHRFDILSLLTLCLALARPSPAATDASTYDWFSLPVEVRGLPGGAESVPVSALVDFSQVLSDANFCGTVDAKSLRLVRLSSNGEGAEIPVQFSSLSQPRLKERPLLAGAPLSISYLGGYRPDGVPKELQVAGQLTWIADHPTQGACRYRLEFGVLRRGSFLQVPFPPQNLQAFDAEGRAMPVHAFPHMQIRPLQPLDGGGEIRNSAGDRNEREAHEKQATWIDQSGPIAENRWGGIAIFDHPDNPRHPTYWHRRNDGWAGAAFNLKDSYKIEPGKPLHLRCRLCLRRDDAVRGNVAGRYAEYETSPQVHIGPVSRKD